jgi:protoheme ferro-lyase
VSTGIVLTTYGEPARNTFGAQWVYSYRILERLTRKIAKIPGPLLPVIATARARSRVALWREHGFTSPLEPLHEETVAALERELRRRGRSGDLVVTRAYEFRRPNLADALGELGRRGCGRAVIVPMYIAGGDFTDGMTRIAVEDALASRRDWTAERLTFCTLSESAGATEELARTLSGHCLDAMDEAGIARPARDWAVLLAAHGTVINPPAGVDNGLLRYGRVLIRLKALLRPHVGLVRIGWLNHTRGGKWSTPAVGDALGFVRARGFEKLVYFPWGFTTDNAETALEGRVALARFSPPFERVEYLKCMNSRSAFVSLLADRVLESLRMPEATTGGGARAIPA